jgi:diguanylate cyclase
MTLGLPMERVRPRQDIAARRAADLARTDAIVKRLLHHARELDETRARLLGRDLAALGVGGGEAVARAVELLAELGGDAQIAWLARLQAAVVAGFVEAMAVRYARDRDRVSRSLTAAHQRELAELRTNLRRLQREALHDPLTGLPNRRYLARWLEGLSGNGAVRVGACVLDLDKFKRINDTIGHDAGDELLRVVSQRLASCVRREGCLLVRYGGDEFVILLADPGGEPDVIAAAELALARVRESVLLSGRTVRVTCSVGVAVVDLDSGEPLDVVRTADSALYHAKSGGKNRWALRRLTPAPYGRALGRSRSFAVNRRPPRAVPRRRRAGCAARAARSPAAHGSGPARRPAPRPGPRRAARRGPRER